MEAWLHPTGGHQCGRFAGASGSEVHWALHVCVCARVRHVPMWEALEGRAQVLTISVCSMWMCVHITAGSPRRRASCPGHR